jgi:type VI secretion system secreted protein Hcp
MKSRTLALVGVLTVAAAAATTFALAHGGDTALIHACVHPSSGDMRIVAATESCRDPEYALDWNQKGEAGAPGAAGPAGPAGPAGAAGAAGERGQDGEDGRDGRDGRDGSSVVTPRAVGTVSLRGAQQGQIGGGQDGTTAAMEILGFSHEIVSPRDAASGLPTGKRQHKPITITKELDAASPQLFQALVNNETLPEVVIAVDRPSQAGYIEYTLTNAQIANWSTSSSAHTDTHELETISFTYQRIELEHVPTARVAQDDWATPAG